jgi:hypothetical protein
VGVERFSTDDIPERDRLAVINEVVARHIAGRHLRPVAGTDLRVEIVAFSLPDQLTVGAGSYSPIIGSRSVDMLDDGRNAYLLTSTPMTTRFPSTGAGWFGWPPVR